MRVGCDVTRLAPQELPVSSAARLPQHGAPSRPTDQSACSPHQSILSCTCSCSDATSWLKGSSSRWTTSILRSQSVISSGVSRSISSARSFATASSSSRRPGRRTPAASQTTPPRGRRRSGSPDQNRPHAEARSGALDGSRGVRSVRDASVDGESEMHCGRGTRESPGPR